MNRWSIKHGAMGGGAVAVVLSGLGTAWGVGALSSEIDPRLEKACHRAVDRKVLLDHRDIETSSFDLEDDAKSLVVQGLVTTRVDQERWADVTWTCNVHPRSARIINVEFREG